VLFMGMAEGRARIYDGMLPERMVNLDELAARWDGTALILSKGRPSRLDLQASAVAPYLIFTLIAACMLYTAQRSVRMRSVAGARSPHFCLGVSSLFVVACAACAVYASLIPGGYLSYSPAIGAIQESKLGTFLKRLSADDVAKLQDSPAVTFIDARREHDFEVGHLRGAINVPPDLGLSDCLLRLTGVPTSRRVVIYCQSETCPYSTVVAHKLLELGYANIALFDGGWSSWEKSRAPREKMAKSAHEGERNLKK